MQLDELTRALRDAWSAETSYGGMATTENPARGQCVVSSLVVQDFLCGELQRVRVTGDNIDEKHYFNVLPDGTIVDTTGMQYGMMRVSFFSAPIDMEGYSSIREKVLDTDTKQRYELLSDRVRRGL